MRHLLSRFPFQPTGGFFVLLLLCFCGFSGQSAAEETVPVLSYFSWPDYIDPEVIDGFEGEYGVKVKQLFFSTDLERDAQLANRGTQGIDVVLVDNTVIEAYGRRDWIAPMDRSQFNNLSLIDERWWDAYPESAGYAVPYAWGTLGFAYRRDLVGREMNSWLDLFVPSAALRGRILMLADRRDLTGMALKALNYSMNTEDGGALSRMRSLLLKQKPHVRAYGYAGTTADSPLVRGSVWAAMAYSGDAMMRKGSEPNVEYVLPLEGGSVWVDYLAIVPSSQHKELAIAFIDYLQRPEIAARNALFTQCGTPNRAAEKLLPESFLRNPAIYPSPEQLERTEPYGRLSARTLRRLNTIYSEVVR